MLSIFDSTLGAWMVSEEKAASILIPAPLQARPSRLLHQTTIKALDFSLVFESAFLRKVHAL